MGPIVGVKPWAETGSALPSQTNRKRKLSSEASVSQADLLRRWVSEIGAALQANPNKRPASERLRELALRVKGKLDNNAPAD